MKKNYLLLATAAAVMAGCANEDFIGDTPISNGGEQAIGFNMNMPTVTRGESNAEHAKSLNYEFIVWGEKEESDAATATTNNANLVFENYRVVYKDNDGNTKNTTVSNTTGWDYVGLTPYTSAQVSPAIASDKTQTIKYWDLGKTYTFTAVSAKPNDISGNKVKITKNASNTSKTTHGYTIELKKGADATAIYVADRYERKHETTATSVDAVQLQFRNFQTKIRFGFYETVPGYNVQITGVKYDSKASYVSDKFGVDGQFITVPTNDDETVTYTVTYDAKNVPVVNVTTSQSSTTTSANYKEFGGNVFNKNLGTTSTSVIYDLTGTDNYTKILPNTNNSSAMSFTVSYKLISEDTGEEIAVTDKKVTVPKAYCQWKPNFAYTYLFKVSDSSTGLYPITFDAVVVDSQTGNQETITEVGEPSIITYAIVSSSDKTVVTGKDEYEDGNVIYAATNTTDGMTNANTALYTVTATTDTNVNGAVAPKITEAAVANCLAKITKDANKDEWVAKDAAGGILTVTKSTAGSFVTNTVPTEDGNGIRTINALTWPATGSTTAETYYAVEYTYSNNKYYKIVKVAKKSSGGN